ncbi:MAG: ABC transporter ATP-binding protein [Solirubrobacterales bacterium]
MLEIRGLRKRYGDREVLRGIDLSVAPGEVVGLLGPNGAGKTTMVSIVAGLREADGGEVTVGGIDALAHSERVRPMIGLAPQDLGIWPILSVEANLRYMGELAGVRGRALRERIGEVADALDLLELLPRRAVELSGGQKRRLHTAMALLHRPALLFLDEPTVGADVRTRRQILDAVKGLAAEGAAVVYATHYLPEVEEIGDSVAVLEDGAIVARGSVGELVAAHGRAQLRLVFDGPAEVLPGFEPDGDGLRIATAEPALLAAQVMRDLGPRAASLRSVEIVQPSLEAAYLALTGRSGTEDQTETGTENGKEDDDVAA